VFFFELILDGSLLIYLIALKECDFNKNESPIFNKIYSLNKLKIRNVNERKERNYPDKIVYIKLL